MSVTSPIEAGTCPQEDVAERRLGALESGGVPPPFQCIPAPTLAHTPPCSLPSPLPPSPYRPSTS